MLYKNYIDQFSVSNETKSTLLNNVLQQANEPQTATKRAADKSAKIAKPKKQNTFRLHPKRWAIILVSVFVVIALIPTLYFTIPRGNSDKSLTMNYITDMMVDMDGVTALGIRREQTTQNAARSYSADANGWSDFLSFGNYVAYADEPQYKNYLYKTSETYEAGNVEYEDGAITRVTFKKNTSKTEEVYDENGNLIDSNTELTQDEMSGQINKVYVGKSFTYMQFIIPVTESGHYYFYDGGFRYSEYVEVRPDSLTYDEYGYSDFDKADYRSTCLTQSFVIDNNTGYIYKIEGMRIDEIISDDCVAASRQYIYNPTNDNLNRFNYSYNDDGYYRISLNEDGTLNFTDVLPNKTVSVYGTLTDKYGWLYINTDTLNDVDEQNKVIFWSGQYKYLISSDKRVFTWGNYYSEMKIDCEVIDGVETPIPNDLTVFNLYHWNALNIFENAEIWGYYKCHIMWNKFGHVNSSNEWVYDIRINGYLTFAEDVGDLVWYDETTVVSTMSNQVRYITLDLDACLQNPRLNITLDEFTLVEATDESLSTGSWQYADSHYVLIGNDKMSVNNVYYKITSTGNVYYQLVKEDGKLQFVKLSDKTYTSNTFVLQPINK